MLGAFIIILVGLVLINSIADSVSELDDIVTLRPNQSFTWAGNNTLVDFDDDDVIISTVKVYSNVTEMGLNINYSIYEEDGVRILNQTEGGGGLAFAAYKYNMSYDHEGDNYLNDSTSRSLINLIVVFFALAILAVGYLIVKKAYENMNL